MSDVVELESTRAARDRIALALSRKWVGNETATFDVDVGAVRQLARRQGLLIY
jgi:hypothetical protein